MLMSRLMSSESLKARLAAAGSAELGDGIHATVDEAVAAATRAFRAFGAQGLAGEDLAHQALGPAKKSANESYRLRMPGPSG